MKADIRKIVVFLFSGIFLFSMTACGWNASNAEKRGQLSNPVAECTRDEMAQITGITLDAPAEASNVRYGYILDATKSIAQVCFQMDGQDYCYRARTVEDAKMPETTEAYIDASADEVAKELTDQISLGEEISGMYYEWKAGASTLLANDLDAVVAFNEGKQGFISWMDTKSNILYSLSVEDGASQQLLMDAAEKSFVPVK